jgi:hypothetical protein
MSEARINRISNEKGDGGPSLSGITTFSGLNYFVPPKGTTAERPSDCPPGSIRFNTDSAHLEYFDGLQWLEFEATNEELGNQLVTNSAGGTGHRAIFAGGYTTPTNRTDIDYVTISTLGNAQDFGDLSTAGGYRTGASSSTRGIFFNAQNTTGIEYVTISSTGSAASFGSADNDYNQAASCSNETRGFRAGGSDAGVTYNNIYYVTIASTGTFNDFGDISNPTQGRLTFAGVNSSTRGVFAGGRSNPSAPDETNIIDYITMSSTGNTQDFGDLSDPRRHSAAACNATRGVFAGGNPNPGSTNLIDFITIATTGNAQDFGDLSATSNTGHQGLASSPTRGLFQQASPSVIEYITIPTTGNAQDFGDTVNTNRIAMGACSNGHGGL